MALEISETCCCGGCRGISADLAVEVPEVDPFGKFFVTLALDVLAYLRADGVCHACGFDLVMGEREGLFHVVASICGNDGKGNGKEPRSGCSWFCEGPHIVGG